MTEEVTVVRNHKDTVFRMLFREKKELLELYNALNDTDYQNTEDLQVYTMDNAVYMNVKNDVSFLFHSELSLFEQQSSYNPNMPLRDLSYITPQLQKYIKDQSLYSTRLVRIPVPRFVVFYNGTQEQPEREILKLSDSFEKPVEDPDLELKVLMLNINQGKNEELLNKCRTLKEYSRFVEKIREYQRQKLPINEAVDYAVKDCIKEGILDEFLSARRAEVIAMSIFEYNEEEEIRKIRRDEYETGWEEGREKGKEEGRLIGEIKAWTEVYRDMGKSKGEILTLIRQRYDLSQERAEGYIEKYWK